MVWLEEISAVPAGFSALLPAQSRRSADETPEHWHLILPSFISPSLKCSIDMHSEGMESMEILGHLISYHKDHFYLYIYQCHPTLL